jgi:hypothetical protein
MPMILSAEEGRQMSTIERITPILARTVMVVAALTAALSVTVTVVVGYPQILVFTGFSALAGGYAFRVLHPDARHPETAEERITRALAA